jgi:hypothetical protein
MCYLISHYWVSLLLHADDDRVFARRSPKPGWSVACTEDAIGEATTRHLAGVVSTTHDESYPRW